MFYVDGRNVNCLVVFLFKYVFRKEFWFVNIVEFKYGKVFNFIIEINIKVFGYYFKIFIIFESFKIVLRCY